MVTRIPFRWGNANFAWNTNPFPNQSSNPFTWDDVALLQELAAAAGGGRNYQEVLKDKKKKKRFITLLCKVKGYDNYKEKKEVRDYTITIEDVELVLKEALNLNIRVEL
jgi:hypothetical protein